MMMIPHVITAHIPVLAGAEGCEATVIVKADISYDYRPGNPVQVAMVGVVLLEAWDLLEQPIPAELWEMAKVWLNGPGYQDACRHAERQRLGGVE